MNKAFISATLLIVLVLFMLTGCKSKTSLVFPVPTITATNTELIESFSQVSTPFTPITKVGENGATLVYVISGEFTMGTDNGLIYIRDKSFEEPAHLVYLDAFWINQTEVTNNQYAQCVAAQICNSPTRDYTAARDHYFSDAAFGNYPVVNITWYDAVAYCKWAGGRLPTEAEWEKAARGTDQRIYPWGNEPPNDELLNYNFTWGGKTGGETTEVGIYPNGVSPYGAYDMAGNVSEWVADWYGDTYYQSSPFRNPLGPEVGKYKVIRGGEWGAHDRLVRSINRNWAYPEESFYSYGFRCVQSE